MSFQDLPLCQELQSAIADQGYSKPTPIQQQAIPTIIQGRDMIACAQTGTGKTAGFTLPMLQRLISNQPTKQRTRALILTPTRELAAQIFQSVQNYGKYLSFTSSVVFGGVKINPQIARLKRHKEIVIATPGRLLDLVQQGALDLSAIEILILDEADRMLDMGFIHDIKRIIRLLPKKRQNLLFSATYSKDIKSFANTLLDHPEQVNVTPPNSTVASIQQIIHPVDRARKRELLSYLIGSKRWMQVLVFTRTKHGANRLCKQLISDGLRSTAIHGNKSQAARTRALDDFKQGNMRVLVATDVAARGLDIQKLPVVVNFDLPNVAEDYVHRIGRTGRALNEGLAMSLVCIDEKPFLADIERLLKKRIPQQSIPGYEVDPSIKAEVKKATPSRKQRPTHKKTNTNAPKRPRRTQANNVKRKVRSKRAHASQ